MYLAKSDTDNEITTLIEQEEIRQRESIVLIASENFVSKGVLQATGSVLTNKYAEGYPNARYYAGCEYVDEVEKIAIERAKIIFNAQHVNVQPHSGTQANMAAFFSVLKPGDRVLAMDLSHGGHLTHGSKVNFSGKLYNFEHYGVDPQSEVIDYDTLYKHATRFKPKMIIAGYSAYSRSIDFNELYRIAKSVNAYLLADISHIAGLVAGGVHTSPIGLADIVTTTTHKTLRGPRGAIGMVKPSLSRKYNSAVFPCLQGGPMMHTIAAKAVAFKEVMQPDFKVYAQQIVINAKAMAQRLFENGLRIVSGGTDTHLFLVDLRNWGVTGLEAENTLKQAGIVANRNTIPFDPAPPKVASGIRIGTAAITTCGMKEDDSRKIADFIVTALKNKDNSHILEKLRKQTAIFASSFSYTRIE